MLLAELYLSLLVGAAITVKVHSHPKTCCKRWCTCTVCVWVMYCYCYFWHISSFFLHIKQSKTHFIIVCELWAEYLCKMTDFFNIVTHAHVGTHTQKGRMLPHLPGALECNHFLTHKTTQVSSVTQTNDWARSAAGSHILLTRPPFWISINSFDITTR